LLEQKHWKYKWVSEGAAKALDTAGYSAAERKIVPGAFVCLPECQDKDRADISKAMIETYACFIKPHLPAYAAAFKAWLAALHYGDYQPFDKALIAAANEVEPQEVRTVMVQGADLPEGPGDAIPIPDEQDQVQQEGEESAEPTVNMEKSLAAAAARAKDTRPKHMRDGSDAPAPPPRAPRQSSGRPSKLKVKAADSVNLPPERAKGERL
jgi:hypothetical protein